MFREGPHLYEGDRTYDIAHLQALAASPKATLIIAYDGDVPVGASTLPAPGSGGGQCASTVCLPWLAAGRYFYFAESVLMPKYRRHGTGATFFRLQEAHFRSVSAGDFTCFCTVQRLENCGIM